MSAGAVAASQAAKAQRVAGADNSPKRRQTYVNFIQTYNPEGLKDLPVLSEKEERKLKRRKSLKFAESISVAGEGGWEHKTIHCCIETRDNKWFQTTMVGVIFLAGILVGIQTYPISNMDTLRMLHVLDQIVLWGFVLEIVVKMVAEGKRPWRYFLDAWNKFDFAIVVVGFMPIGGGGAVTALRLIRLLRVLKLVKALPKLRILVIGLIASIPSIAYIGVLLGMQFFLFAVVAQSIFGKNDPENLGTLHITLLTLFRCATLEDWTDIMYITMYGCDKYGYDEKIAHKCTEPHAFGTIGALYWVVFIILATFMILNLFIGVITSSMQEAKEELLAEAEAEAASKKQKTTDDHMIDRVAQMEQVLEAMHNEVGELSTYEKLRGSAGKPIKLSNRRAKR
eukprot:g563.t1